jgi:hypothetical protein
MPPTDKSPLRQAYDAIERRVAPPLTDLAGNPDAVNLLALAGQGRRFVGRRIEGVATSMWHLANLPARRDVQRLRVQIGQLDREVRRLTVQLELESERRQERDERA